MPGYIGRRLPGFDGTSVDNEVFWTRVSETFDAWLLDMEGAAVARVDCTDDVSFVAARSLGNLARGE
ncbi:MAG: 5'-methylthioadenosine/S-adenosylhomocysteine nucleosidase [Boseongicola sp. SB0677_bin_26]|nr:5'-methylthioadenosine/S-adenosylhomocysteine nucleosidase [Boseongicola sp. SB0665_bin_10]MYG27538.1 5'-methylthioadenosine/S-adenosylhomocysteine nucleosidase [Boseongicola sp. SB0677_bin_26]